MKNDGFTIVEVIISMAILSVALLVATLGFTTVVSLQEKAQTAQGIQQNVRYIAEVLNRDVRSSDTYELQTSSPPPQLLLPNSINEDSMVRYTYNPEGEGHVYRYPCDDPFCDTGSNTAGENLVPENMRVTTMDMEKLVDQSGTHSPLQVYISATQEPRGLDDTDPYAYEYDTTVIVVPRR